jgi:hypothetical protein
MILPIITISLFIITAAILIYINYDLDKYWKKVKRDREETWNDMFGDLDE